MGRTRKKNRISSKIDELPSEIKGQVDVMLSDTSNSYQDVSGWLKEKGYGFHIDSPTNQQFVVLENKKLEELRKEVSFSIWEKKDADHTVVRFATSWATKEEDIRKLLALM